MTQGNAVDFRRYFAVVLRWWWLIAGCTLLAAVVAFAVSSRMRPVYSASVTLLVDSARPTGTSDYSDILASERLANTYSQMLAGQPVLEETIARLGLAENPASLAGRVSVESVRDTRLIQLAVVDTDPTQASLLANTVTEVFVEQIQALHGERYAESLASMQEQMDELAAQVEETQAEIDTLSASAVWTEAELAREETLLAEQSSDYRALEQEDEDLRLIVTQLADSVQLVEAAQVPEYVGQSPYTATATVYTIQPGDTLDAIALRFNTTVAELMEANNIAESTSLRAGTEITVAQPPENQTQPIYTVTATLLVDQVLAMGRSDNSAILASEQLANTYRQMLTGQSVLEETIAQLGLEETSDALAERIQVEAVPDTQLIRLSVEDADPAQAALLANTTARALITQAQTLLQEPYTNSLASLQAQMDELSAQMEETQAEINALSASKIQETAKLDRLEAHLAESRSDYRTLQKDQRDLRLIAAQSMDTVNTVEAAEVPTSPIRPNKLRNTILAAVVGAMLAVGVAFLVELLDDTLETPEDARQMLGLETLGAIGRMANGDERLIAVARPRSPIVEAYRALGTSIRFHSVDRPIGTLLLTSPNPYEGKSATSANLAVVMAQSGKSVILVDADLRRSSLHKFFNMPNKQGLTSILLEDELSLDGWLHKTAVDNLRLLTSGPLPPNPAELLGSQRLQEVLHALAEQADMVILDSPPVLPVADAAALAPWVDGVLLILEAGRTRGEAARKAVEHLRQVGVDPIGVVLNSVPFHIGEYYYYGDGAKRGTYRSRHWKDKLTTAVPMLGRKR